MKRAPAPLRATFCAVLGLAAACAPATRAQDLPAATNVIARLIERSGQVATNAQADQYLYDKRSLMEELDASGNAVQTTEKLYRVSLISGVPFARLVKIQGRDLTPAELQKQGEREQRFRNKISARDPKDLIKHKEPLVTHDLTDRFQFTVVKREPCEGRPAVVLDFAPKPAQAPAKDMSGQILNRLAGRLWVDEQDAELASVDMHLTESVSLGWLGIFGSLKQIDFSLRRQRTSEGVWVAHQQTLLLGGRKLASAMRYRITETCSGFRRP
jgi:hypothetical protein